MSKLERVHQIQALCVKNDVTPHKTVFADFIIHVCAAAFGFDKRTSRSYIDTLIQSWRFDRWKTMIQTNHFLKEEEKQQWIGRNSGSK